jgi:hypothetical protein
MSTVTGKGMGLLMACVLASVALLCSSLATSASGFAFSYAGTSRQPARSATRSVAGVGGRQASAGSNEVEWLDDVRADTFREVAGYVRDANAFLIDSGLDDLVVSGSYFEVSLDVKFEHLDGATDSVLVPRVDADLSCPGLDERWRLFVESLEPGASSATDIDTIDSSAHAGLRRILFATREWDAAVSGGIKWEWPPRPFAELELERDFEFIKWRMRPGASLFWVDGEGFGSVASFRANRWFLNRIVARSESSVMQSETSEGVEWAQTLGAAFVFDKAARWRERAVGFRVDAFGRRLVDGPEAVLCRTSILYRQPLYRDWLRLRLSPGVEFREDVEDPVPFVRLCLDIHFRSAAVPAALNVE